MSDDIVNNVNPEVFYSPKIRIKMGKYLVNENLEDEKERKGDDDDKEEEEEDDDISLKTNNLVGETYDKPCENVISNDANKLLDDTNNKDDDELVDTSNNEFINESDKTN